MLAQRAQHQPRHICFAAQQASEKAIKARFVARQVDFPFTHQIDELVARLEAGSTAGADSGDLEWLSQWGVAPRYPGDVEPRWPDAERAVMLARRIVEATIESLA